MRTSESNCSHAELWSGQISYLLFGESFENCVMICSVFGKFDCRLAGWKCSSLSIGSRLVLVNSILSALPIYLMSFYLLPKWDTDRMDNMRRSFLWKCKKDVNSCSFNKLESVCKSKQQGGLGVLDIILDEYCFIK